MRTTHFELSVVGASEDAAAGTVTLSHQQTFKVALTNHLPRRRCNVRLSYNGKEFGEFRVPGGQTVVIKRPVNDATPFTFLQVGTAEAKASGLALDGTAGVFQAVFVPESSAEERLIVEHGQVTADAAPLSKEEAADLATAFSLAPVVAPPFDALVYSVKADGTFQEADDIFSFNESETVEIEVRLEGKPDPTLSIDHSDVLRAAMGRLEIAETKAIAEFDYDVALKLGKQIRVKQGEVARLEFQGEVARLRRELEALRVSVK